jgi:hypothetical protein
VALVARGAATRGGRCEPAVRLRANPAKERRVGENGRLAGSGRWRLRGGTWLAPRLRAAAGQTARDDQGRGERARGVR